MMLTDTIAVQVPVAGHADRSRPSDGANLSVRRLERRREGMPGRFLYDPLTWKRYGRGYTACSLTCEPTPLHIGHDTWQ